MNNINSWDSRDEDFDQRNLRCKFLAPFLVVTGTEFELLTSLSRVQTLSTCVFLSVELCSYWLLDKLFLLDVIIVILVLDRPSI